MFMWAFENTVLEDSKKKYKKTIRIKSPYHFYNFPKILTKFLSFFFFLITKNLEFNIFYITNEYYDN